MYWVVYICLLLFGCSPFSRKLVPNLQYDSCICLHRLYSAYAKSMHGAMMVPSWCVRYFLFLPYTLACFCHKHVRKYKHHTCAHADMLLRIHTCLQYRISTMVRQEYEMVSMLTTCMRAYTHAHMDARQNIFMNTIFLWMLSAFKDIRAQQKRSCIQYIHACVHQYRRTLV